MARFRARKRWKVGPSWLHYFRNYSANIGEGRGRAGFTSHGIRVHIPLAGPVTWNFTTGVRTWDSPGPGSVTF
jgi:hypothetical protein